jgi:hypothetical protein
MSSRKHYPSISGGDSLKPVKNLVASVHQRLKNVAHETHRPFNEIVQYYALERWLYRLAQSRYHDRVVLKGALMLLVWKTPLTRPTRDIDLLGRINNSAESIAKFVTEVSQTAVEDDGMRFDVSKLTIETVTEDADYVGRRAKFIGWLGKTRLPMQIDIGFSDVITPEPASIGYPTDPSRKDIELSPSGFRAAAPPSKISKTLLLFSEMQSSRIVPLASAPGRLRGAVFHNTQSLRCAQNILCQKMLQHNVRESRLMMHKISELLREQSGRRYRLWQSCALVVYAQAQRKRSPATRQSPRRLNSEQGLGKLRRSVRRSTPKKFGVNLVYSISPAARRGE